MRPSEFIVVLGL